MPGGDGGRLCPEHGSSLWKIEQSTGSSSCLLAISAENINVINYIVTLESLLLTQAHILDEISILMKLPGFMFDSTLEHTPYSFKGSRTGYLGTWGCGNDYFHYLVPLYNVVAKDA